MIYLVTGADFDVGTFLYTERVSNSIALESGVSEGYYVLLFRPPALPLTTVHQWDRIRVNWDLDPWEYGHIQFEFGVTQSANAVLANEDFEWQQAMYANPQKSGDYGDIYPKLPQGTALGIITRFTIDWRTLNRQWMLEYVQATQLLRLNALAIDAQLASAVTTEVQPAEIKVVEGGPTLWPG